MTEPILIHHQVAPFFESRDGQWWVQLWLTAEANPVGVYLRLEPDNEERLVPMELAGQRGRFQVYQAELTPNPAEALTVYAFKTLWADRQWWLDAAGTSRRMPLRERFFRLNTEESPPDWVPDQVFYQVFPERFRNGDPALSPSPGAWVLRDEGPIGPASGANPSTRRVRTVSSTAAT